MNSCAHKPIAAMRERKCPGSEYILGLAEGSKIFMVDGNLLEDEALIDFGFDLIEQKLLRLPFTKTTLEIVNPPTFPEGSRAFVFCMEGDGLAVNRETKKETRNPGDCQIIASYFIYVEAKRKIAPGLFFLDTADPSDNRLSFTLQTIDVKNPVPHEEADKMLNYLMRIIAAFVALINSKSAKVNERLAPEKLNRARAKRGKPPLLGVRVVDVPTPQRGEPKRAGGQRSPRMHWRRGHLRHWKDRIILVSPCLVGVAENGVVEQIYRARVKPP
jgi:hypothetical protein